jgi:predicted outer membrane repeat protein
LKLLIIFLALFIQLYGKTFNVTNSKEFYLALKSSENNQEDDVIVLSRGRYISSFRYPFYYDSSEDFDLTIKGEDGVSRSNIILDGNGIRSTLKVSNQKYRIIVSVSGLTIQNGYTKNQGGGIFIDNKGELDLDNVVIAYNRSDYDGGGVHTFGTVIVNNSIIARNESARGLGGGIFSGNNSVINASILSYNFSKKHGGGLFSTKTSLIKNSKVTNNSSGYGGGFYGETKITIQKSVFTGNSAKYDGGAVKSISTDLYDINFSNNTAGNYGGAINSDKVDLENIIFRKNSAKYGGAIFSKNAKIKKTYFLGNNAKYGGGALKSTKVIARDSKFILNTTNRSGGAISSDTIISSNSDFKRNSSYKGGAIFTKTGTFTDTIFSENRATNSGGAIKGFNIKVRYSTLCENSSGRNGGAIDGVDIIITKSNLTKNRSYKGGAIFTPHTAKLNITDSFIFQNSATYGGAIFGNVKIFNSLLLKNYGKGMALYGKGLIVNSIIKNSTAPDLVSQEIYLNGHLSLENNHLTLSNIYNYHLYKVATKGNEPLKNIKNKLNLSEVFGENEISEIGIFPDVRKSCKELFDTRKAYSKLLHDVEVEVVEEEKSEKIEILSREREREIGRTSIVADISDLVIEGDHKCFKEQQFVTVIRHGKNKIVKHMIDFGEGRGYEYVRGNSANYRFHTSGIKDVKVKIEDSEGNVIEKKFAVPVYELSKDDFKEIIQDQKSRQYLEGMSRGILKIIENPEATNYHKAIGIETEEGRQSNFLETYIGELRDDQNLTKMLLFNNGMNEIEEYFIDNLKELNIVSKGEESNEAIASAKKYILENPQEFNLTHFKNYEEIITLIEEKIMENLDGYDLTSKKNLKVAKEDGKKEVVKNPKKFNLLSMNEVQDEMVKLTDKIKADPSKFGIRITKKTIENLPKGWSLLGTLADIKDVTIFDGVQIVWIFAGGEFKGYSPLPDIRRKIRNSQFEVFNYVPKNAGLWLHK